MVNADILYYLLKTTFISLLSVYVYVLGIIIIVYVVRKQALIKKKKKKNISASPTMFVGLNISALLGGSSSITYRQS